MQLVHGTPREAASHRTCAFVTIASHGCSCRDYSLCASGMLYALLAFVAFITHHRQTEVPRQSSEAIGPQLSRPSFSRNESMHEDGANSLSQARLAR